MTDLWVKLVRGFMILLSRFPLKFHYFWGGVFAWFAKNVMKYRYDVVMINLARSFPEKKYGELKRIADDFYTHFGEIVAEAIWFGGSDRKRVRRQQICRALNPEVLNEAFESSPGVTILDSHCGNWELLGGFYEYNYSDAHPYPFTEDEIYVVYKEMKSKVWDEVFKRNRCNLIDNYTGLVESGKVLRTALRNKDKKAVYLCNSDQSPYMGMTDIGNFLSQKTYAMMGIISVAHKMSMSVLYMRMVRKEKGSYEISFIKLCEDASKHSPEEILRRYYDELEKEIRETPANWLWSHKRWKH